MGTTVRRYEVTDDEWEIVSSYIPKARKGSRGRPATDSRKMLNGICWIMRSGAAWRDLPERYGPWQTVYKRFVKWQEAGIFERIFKDLALDADMQDISIDSTCIKAHKASAGAKKRDSDGAKGSTKDDDNREKYGQKQCIRVTRGGKNTKIHAVVDGLGYPIHLQLSSGNISDVSIAREVLSHVDLNGTIVMGDKAYGAKELRDYNTSQNADYCIPPKSNTVDPWECDWYQYKERHLVECFFNRLKENRRIATRFDKLASRFSLSFILVVSESCLHRICTQCDFRNTP